MTTEKKETVEFCGDCIDRFFEHLELICKGCKDCKKELKKIKEHREKVKAVAKEGLVYCCC